MCLQCKASRRSALLRHAVSVAWVPPRRGIVMRVRPEVSSTRSRAGPEKFQLTASGRGAAEVRKQQIRLAPEPPEILLAVGVVAEERAAFVSPRRHVIQRAANLEAGWTRHGP